MFKIKLFKLLLQMTRPSKSDDPELAKAQAQIEIEEARAFKKGKYSPKYVLKYCIIFLAFMFSVLFIIGLFFPKYIDLSHPLDTIGILLRIIPDLGGE